MTNIEQSICDAIEIIVERSISQASFDRTIQATIVECIDQTIGKYKAKYQDSTFYAYSESSDVTYTNGSTVYILIPGNDMDADKTILGTTKKLGINYVVTTEGDEAYQIIGNNCISSSSNSFNLQSYREDKQVKVLYSKQYTANQNLISLDKTAINEYIKNQKTIICGGVFRNNLPAEQQFRGNFGIIFALNFADNTNNAIVTRYYTIDVDKMRGNPYKILYDTRQYGIFDIDGDNFIEVDSISIFCYDFPNNKPVAQCIDDIFIKDIELCGAERLSDDDLSNYSLTFNTPQGIYFDSTSLMSDIRTLEALVRVKGKVIDNNSQKLPFYWFIEHAGITSESTYYNKYGGQGWKCLNDYNIIKSTTDEDPEVVEWIPATNIWTVSKKDITAKEVKYKCVVVYDGTIVTRTITIKNLASNYDITIESSEETQFYFDIGYPTLKCLINGKEDSNLTYAWAVTNNVGTFETISSTPIENENYLIAYNNYHTLLDNIEKERIPLEPNKTTLENYKNELDRYEKVMRVDGNTIWHLNVNTITSFSTYQCTVYQGDLYLGTASIVLTNSLNAEGSYTMTINNGSCVFKYDENGVSPASQAVDSPMEINALTFNVYDNLGNRIDDDIIRHSSIQWIVPIENTMIVIPSSYTEYQEDLENGIRIYENFMSFTYNIESRYDITKNNNDIQILVNYKGIILSAKTDLVFTKEGDEGTNGTEFFCRIVPNVLSGREIPTYPTLTELSDYSWSLNYITQSTNRFFKVQLWHNENKILDSVTTANTTEGKEATIKWSILKNKYSSNISDSSALTVNENTGIFSYSGYRSDSPAHIVKVEVTYNKVVYYATIPLITVKIRNNNYRVNLKDGTGFLTAVYSSDGKRPRYNNTNPFELKVTQNISGYEEDISSKTSSTYTVSYSWNYLGQIYEKSWVSNINLGDRITSDTYASNQKAVKPLDDYDGQCVTNAIEGIVTKSGIEIGRIHIPIHLMLNRYGNSAINGWDGNSVNIDSNSGFILAPQVGAGIKENDNSFTGVVIGKVKEANQSTADIGLFGYAKGVRSIFLDAQTGKAVFGSNGKGQITIDPTQNTARIYSGNFYYNSNGSGTGMEIDLTTPRIRFGSGNFEVSKEGHLIAKGGGSIGGWSITDTELYSPGKKITLDSANSKIYSGSKSLFNSSSNGFYLDPDYLVLGSKFKAFASGKLEIGTGAYNSGSAKHWIIDGDSKDSYIQYGTKGSSDSVYIGTSDIQLGKGFSVTSAGLLKVGNLGTNGKYWTIASKMGSTYPAFISYNHTVSTGSNGELIEAPTIDSEHPSNSMYIGTDGIAIGNRFTIAANNNGKIVLSHNAGSGLDDTTNGFYLSSDGIRIGNRFKATLNEVLIGNLLGKHWTINGGASNAYIAYGGTTVYSTADSESSDTAKVYLGTDGISLGRRFSVSDKGELTAYSGEIGGWKISRYIIKAGNIELNSNGSMKGGTGSSTWEISQSGIATFNNLRITGGSIQIKDENNNIIASIDDKGKVKFTSGTIGGWNISTNKLTAGNIELNSEDGTIRGGGNYEWSIGKQGKATFSNIVANGGTIGGWNITASDLYHGNIHISSEGSIYSKGAASGNSWEIKNNGSASFSNIEITGGSLEIKNASDEVTASISNRGKVDFTSGTIGGWTLGKKTLTGGSVTFNSEGSLKGPKWEIDTNGTATFSDINVKGGSINLGGATINSAGTKLTAGNTSVGNKTLRKYIEDLTVGTLEVEDEFTFQNKKVKWKKIKCMTQINPNTTVEPVPVVTNVSMSSDGELKVTKGNAVKGITIYYSYQYIFGLCRRKSDSDDDDTNDTSDTNFTTLGASIERSVN